MARASKPEKEARRRKVAAAVVAGKKTKEIARAIGVQPREARRIAAQPATRLLIARVMQPHHAALGKLAGQAVKVVARGLKASYRGRPMYAVQLDAVREFERLAHLAQGSDKQRGDGDGLVTWQQFIVLYESRDKGAA